MFGLHPISSAAISALTGQERFASAVESVQIIESTSSVFTASTVIFENITSQDSSSVSSTFNASANDVLQVYDLCSPAGSIYNSSFTGDISISDSNQGLNTISLSISESASVADQYAAKFTASAYVVERSVAIFGPISISIIRFDYEAVKDLYSRKRTAYVSRSSQSVDRVIIVPAMNRTVYIPRPTVSEERTASVGLSSRITYADKQAATSAERTIIVN